MRPNLAQIVETPWALTPQALRWLVDWVASGAAVPVQAQWAADHPTTPTTMGKVAIVPIHGVIEHRADWLGELFGATSVEQVRAQLAAALADQAVRAVVLDIDSPGGTVAGLSELAADIRAARGGEKPIVALANTLAASAAYWLAAQADEVVATPSGAVGGVGVFAVHQEASRMLDGMGITTTIISAGEHKTEANEYEPLTDDARAAIQERTDAFYRMFVTDVARGRRVTSGQVEADYGQGRVILAEPARAAGMVDRVATLEQTARRLAGATSGGRRQRAGLLGPELQAAAIRRHETGTTSGPWDGAEAEARLPSGEGAAETLRQAYAWVDDDGDPNVKASYKFPHHEVSADGTVGDANTTACSTGIGYLNRPPGAAGRPDIPDADRSGVHAHLAGHITDAGLEAPPLTGQAISPFHDRLTALAAEADDLVEYAQHRARSRAADGRPAFTTATETALRVSRDAIDALLTGEPDGSAVAQGQAGEPPAPAAPAQPPAQAPVPIPHRFRSDADWERYLQGLNRGA